MLYLRLFHGRTHPDESLDDWGSDGPIVGPFESAHWTYGSLKLATENGEDLLEFDQLVGLDQLGQPREDLIHVMGVWYGDFALFERATPPEGAITWSALQRQMHEWQDSQPSTPQLSTSPMQLDTKTTLYLGLDGTNGEVRLLVPRDFDRHGLKIVELRLDDPNPDNTDAAEFKLLETEMDETRYDT